MLRTGAMVRAGTFYLTPDAPPSLAAFLEAGVRPTCLTAGKLHDLWIPVHTGDHVYRPRGIEQVRREEGWVGHGAGMRSWPDLLPYADLALTLEHAGRCLPVRDAAILLESAVQRKKITLHQARQVVESLPWRERLPLRRIDPRAESGTETAVRWWLESLRVAVTPQVWIEDVGRVDLKIGRSWIIECDSSTFHDNSSQYYEDRRRDLLLQARGYTVTRLTWEQVFLSWDSTTSELLRALRRRDHQRALPR